MEVIDKTGALFQIDEIFKYKDLIDREDREVLKAIINKEDEKSLAFYNRFLEMVIDEADHKLNKTEFAGLRNELVAEMKSHLGN
ncbi:hypothetical protein FRY74_04340 [Vicingus serpentipes]|uniref:Uncharacterized protein n=1 Tax=Vicingus serpentipes TaxID=1926625 RepID=A0A5C6RU19_9FLAO|nr:hypothetical protein [Vicingus serpentipes]TXB65801.1 hypothetical protein FRY74_04340 [Vicingus serpentipes]